MTNNFELDFMPRRQLRWVGWALLGLGLFAVAEIDLRRQEMADQLAVWRGEESGNSQPSKAKAGAPEDGLKEAAGIVDQLAMPWSPLFGALERAQVDTVALLAVQPDAQRRMLTLAGEAKGYPEVLEYASRLRSEAKLSNVYLVSNEVKEDQPQRPVAFTITAEWRAVQ